MKKKLVSMICLTVMILSALPLVGCVKVTPQEETIMLTSFESYKQLVSFDSTSYFGTIGLNEDKNYVSHGSRSLKVYPYGDSTLNIAPVMTITTYLPFQDAFDIMDYSKYKYIAFDAFNPQDEDIVMSFWLTCQDKELIERTTLVRQYTLPANGKTKILYDFAEGALSKGYPLNNVRKLNFGFPLGDEDNAPTLYFDNLQAQTLTSEYKIDSSGGTLLNFERAGDKSLLMIAENVVLTHNSNKTFTTEGNCSLKVESGGTMAAKLALEPSIFDAAVLSRATALSADVYNDGSGHGAYSLEVVYINSETLAEIRVVASVSMEPGKWNTLTISSADLPSGQTFASAAYIDIILASNKSYLDNIRAVIA